MRAAGRRGRRDGLPRVRRGYMRRFSIEFLVRTMLHVAVMNTIRGLVRVAQSTALLSPVSRLGPPSAESDEQKRIQPRDEELQRLL